MKEERHWQRKTHSDTVCPVTLILTDSFKMFPHFHMLLQNWCTLWYLDENDSPLKCTVSISCADYNCESKGVGSNTSAGCLDMYTQEYSKKCHRKSLHHQVCGCTFESAGQSENKILCRQRVLIFWSTKGQRWDVHFNANQLISLNNSLSTSVSVWTATWHSN